MSSCIYHGLVFIPTGTAFPPDILSTFLIDHAEYAHGTESYEEVAEQYVSEATDAEETEQNSIEVPELTEPEETTPITVDFEALRKENGDVVGWLYCEDTPINYPIVQSEDNDYYLRRLLDSTWNIAGTIFMDYRNAPDFSDWNTIIYGHNMNNDSMFGTLQDYKKQAYYEEHPVLYKCHRVSRQKTEKQPHKSERERSGRSLLFSIFHTLCLLFHFCFRESAINSIIRISAAASDNICYPL